MLLEQVAFVGVRRETLREILLGAHRGPERERCAQFGSFYNGAFKWGGEDFSDEHVVC